MMRVMLLSSFILGSTALQAAPLPMQPYHNDMVLSVVDGEMDKDSVKKKKKAAKKDKQRHPAIMALREKYKARREAARGDKEAMMALKKEFKAEAKALREELGLKTRKKGQGKEKKMLEEQT